MNFVTLAGFLGSDPEERMTPNGQKIISFRLGVRARRDETIWYRITIWGDHRLVPYLKKGKPIIVGGELQKPNIYTDRNGQPAVGLEVTAEMIKFVPSTKQDQESEGGSSFAQQSVQVAPAAGVAPVAPVAPAAPAAAMDNDLPF